MKKSISAQPIDNAIHDFMSVTAKNTVAVIIPLYGYWSDIKNNPLIKEKVLSAVMQRIYSNTHQLYLIFVAHPESIPGDTKTPGSVANVLITMSQAGNVKSIPVKRDATYPEYIQAGLDYALNETNAQFIMTFNPWVLVQDNAIDIIIDRANRGDDAKVVSGFDFHTLVKPEEFDQFNTSVPTEEWDLSFNFLAMPRFMAETIIIDTEYLTHQFLERDIWQSVFNKGFAVITSQRVPIFPFEFPWEIYETSDMYELDKQHFGRKWGFVPEFKETK